MRSTSRVSRIVFGATVLAFAAIGAVLYLSRSIEVDYFREGLARYHMSWGRVKSVEIDINRDGMVDLRAVYAFGWRSVSTADPWESHSESSNCDGRFDTFVTYDLQGGFARVAVDRDLDGNLEADATGPSSVELLKQTRAAGCLAQWGKDPEALSRWTYKGN